MSRFKCKNCGFTIEVESSVPPEKCPGCQATCSMVDDACYIPDCSDQKEGR